MTQFVQLIKLLPNDDHQGVDATDYLLSMADQHASAVEYLAEGKDQTVPGTVSGAIDSSTASGAAEPTAMSGTPASSVLSAASKCSWNPHVTTHNAVTVFRYFFQVRISLLSNETTKHHLFAFLPVKLLLTLLNTA